MSSRRSSSREFDVTPDPRISYISDDGEIVELVRDLGWKQERMIFRVRASDRVCAMGWKPGQSVNLGNLRDREGNDLNDLNVGGQRIIAKRIYETE